MATLHWYNPTNDLALATQQPHYTPPATAVALERACCMLPMWWAQHDDVILVPDTQAALTAADYAAAHRLHGVPAINVPEVITDIDPWGWSKYAVRHIKQAGANQDLLPPPQRLDMLRDLSHRRITVEVHRRLGTLPQHMPVECYDVGQAMQCICRMGRAVVKLPWSSSGRGILLAHEIPFDTLKGYIEGMIARQGSVMVEPFYEKTTDMAALFLVSPYGCVTYQGVSVFHADNRGRYKGNLILSQKSLLDISKVASEITAIVPLLRVIIHDLIAPYYNGWVGVDMLTYTDRYGHLQLAPCIEVNLRHTMGTVALSVWHHTHKPSLIRVTKSGIDICNI